jgi:hypothetical protein
MSAIQEEKLTDAQVCIKDGAVNTVVGCDAAYRVGHKSPFYFVDVAAKYIVHPEFRITYCS